MHITPSLCFSIATVLRIVAIFAVALSSLYAQNASPTRLQIPQGAVAHLDLPYVANGHERQVLDLYLPPTGEGPFPLVVWVHGGAWSGGSKENCRFVRTGYLQRGYAVASINYRLSQHAIFPAQIQDCKAAIRWLRAHAAKFGFDPSRIGVAGSSAGGHLVALLGTTGDIAALDVGEHLDQSSRVQAVCNLYGPTDFVQMDANAVKGVRQKHDAPDSPESRLIGGPIQDPANYPKVQAANPITYVTADDTPFLIIHGDADPTVPHHQSELLYAALTQSGIPTHFITVIDGGHGQRFPAKDLDPQIADFFDRHLKGDMTAAPWPAAKVSSVAATK